MELTDSRRGNAGQRETNCGTKAEPTILTRCPNTGNRDSKFRVQSCRHNYGLNGRCVVSLDPGCRRWDDPRSATRERGGSIRKRMCLFRDTSVSPLAGTASACIRIGRACTASRAIDTRRRDDRLDETPEQHRPTVLMTNGHSYGHPGGGAGVLPRTADQADGSRSRIRRAELPRGRSLWLDDRRARQRGTGTPVPTDE